MASYRPQNVPKGVFGWGDFRENGKWKREKWRENDIFGCLVEGGKEERFWWGPQVFSPPPSKYNLSKLERNLEWKVGKYLDKTAPTSFNVFGIFFFFTFPFSANAGFLFLFFFYSLVLSRRGGFFFFSFFLIFFNYFLRKHFWIFFSLFFEMSTFIYTQFFFKSIMYYFLFYLRGIWW